MLKSKALRALAVLSFCVVYGAGCGAPPRSDDPGDNGNDNGNGPPTGPLDDGPVAERISAALGEVMPEAAAEQRQTFARGREVFQKRFDLADGLGPTFNVAFCGGCHERPVPGGSSGLYRNFFLSGRLTGDGAFLFSDSEGAVDGVLRVYQYDSAGEFRPGVPRSATIFAQRNAIPMFGIGALAALSEEEILRRADPDDLDGDGVSGRPNYDGLFVGRFGRKAQTRSIEGFIRGPLFNHLGVTTDPLTDEQRAALPVDSSRREPEGVGRQVTNIGQRLPHQAAASDDALVDDDAARDPEMSGQELFDLVSFVMLLAAPELEEPTAQSNRGRLLFHEAGCSACHAPRLNGPQGPLPVYSDLLLHDMGRDLADDVLMNDATGSEFRTQPLWGIAATGPYLHDGRAMTIEEAVLAHGGEADSARRAFEDFSTDQRGDVVEFLLSLGGRSQATSGLLVPGSPIPSPGEYGGPFRALKAEEEQRFLSGREVFDRDFGFSDGVGALAGPDGAGRFNGDSCRACHFDPVIGGAGPRGVNVMRHGAVSPGGAFAAPPDTPNTILHKTTQIGMPMVAAHPGINVFEHRQTPHAFGAGRLEAIDEQAIIDGADPDDADDDGISGRVHVLDDGRIGRFGWKADVPSVAEFVRDAMAAEIGLTLPPQEGLTFGVTEDGDGVPDPELSLEDAEDLAFFMIMLAGPPRQAAADSAAAQRGQGLFTTVGCSKCHRPSMPGSLGEVPLYSDLLLHEILPPRAGIVSGDADQREFRTAPLWGLSRTAPYFHSGEADTIADAIRLHDGEALDIRNAYLALPEADRRALLAFLDTL